MFQRRACVISLFTLGLFGCTSVRHEKLEPLTVLRHQDVLRVIEPGAAKLDAHPTPTQGPEQGPKVRVKLAMFGVEPECLQQALGEGPQLLGAAIVPREQAARLCTEMASRDGDGVHVLSDTKLEVFAGNSACLALSNERAFVGAFEISTSATGAIADPRIDVAQEGILFRVDVGPIQAGEDIGFCFELTQCFLDRRFMERRVEVSSGLTPLTLQVPISIRDRLSAKTELRAEEAIVIGRMRLASEQDGRAMLAVLTAELASD